MPDEAHVKSDEILAALETRLNRYYASARREIREEVSPYVDDIYLDDEEATQKERMRHAEDSGNIPKIIAAYVAIMLLANENAISRINDATARIYNTNYNYMAGVIQGLSAQDLGFLRTTIAQAGNIVDDVRGYYDQRAYDQLVDRGILTKEITKAIQTGVKNGESIPKIAKRIERTSNKSKNRSVLTARTETTRVENIARQETYDRATEMGIKLGKMWVATMDNRTRDSHIGMHGEIVPVDEYFSNGGFFPGDHNLPIEETANCRCTTQPEILD